MGNCQGLCTVYPYESIVIVEEITPALVDVCKTSWQQLTGDACLADAIPNSPKLDILCAEILSRLVAHPDVYSTFRPRKSFNRPMLIYRLVRYVLSVKDSSLKIKRQLRSMGRNHMRIGVTEQQIRVFNEVYLKSFHSQFGHRCTRRVYTAWKSLLQFVTEQFYFDRITFIAHFTKDPVSALAPVSAMRRNSVQLRSETFHSGGERSVHSLSLPRNSNHGVPQHVGSQGTTGVASQGRSALPGHQSGQDHYQPVVANITSKSNYIPSGYGRPGSSSENNAVDAHSRQGDDDEITIFENFYYFGNNQHSVRSRVLNFHSNYSNENSSRFVAGSQVPGNANSCYQRASSSQEEKETDAQCANYGENNDVVAFDDHYETCGIESEYADELEIPVTVHEVERVQTLMETRILRTSRQSSVYDGFTALGVRVFKVSFVLCRDSITDLFCLYSVRFVWSVSWITNESGLNHLWGFRTKKFTVTTLSVIILFLATVPKLWWWKMLSATHDSNLTDMSVMKVRESCFMQE
jgi:hemoglobin-like flavoprotein